MALQDKISKSPHWQCSNCCTFYFRARLEGVRGGRLPVSVGNLFGAGYANLLGHVRGSRLLGPLCRPSGGPFRRVRDLPLCPVRSYSLLRVLRVPFRRMRGSLLRHVLSFPLSLVFWVSCAVVSLLLCAVFSLVLCAVVSLVVCSVLPYEVRAVRPYDVRAAVVSDALAALVASVVPVVCVTVPLVVHV